MRPLHNRGVTEGLFTRASKIHAAALRLYIDELTVEAVRMLGKGGVRAILLKGPTIANWLYLTGEPRPYIDSDLLVSPRQLTAAGAALSQLGLERLVDETVADGFAEPHAVTWRRPGDHGTVDLHWRIPGIAADPARSWERLCAGTEGVSVARAEVEALGKPARTLHLALHAVQNGREATQPMDDLRRGIAHVDESTWEAAAGLAADLEAMPPFAAGVRMTPEGAVLADRLGLPSSTPTRWVLSAQTPPPGAMRLHEFGTTRGSGAKARWLAAVLLPPPAYIRGLYPSARRSRRALALAYVRRPLAGIRNAPRAVRALRQARAEARAAPGSAPENK